jgi:hypothetical protein
VRSYQKQSACRARACRAALGEVEGGARLLLPDKGRQRGEAHLGVDAALCVKNGRTQAGEAKAAAALPAHRLADAARLARDDLLQPGQAVRGGVLAHLDADPAAAHLVRHGGRGAGAEEAVEDQVAGGSGGLQNAFNDSFGFRKRKFLLLAKKGNTFLCPVLCVLPFND